jgi:hypothetical protein
MNLQKKNANKSNAHGNIECLKLSKIANESLNEFFQKQNVIEICLLDFMDSIITGKLKKQYEFI